MTSQKNGGTLGQNLEDELDTVLKLPWAYMVEAIKVTSSGKPGGFR